MPEDGLRAIARRAMEAAPAPLRSQMRRLKPDAYARDLALNLLESGEWAAAAAAYERLTRSAPEHPVHWIGLARARTELGAERTAATAADQARRLVPPGSELEEALAEVDRRLGRTKLSEPVERAALARLEASPPVAIGDPVAVTRAADLASRLKDWPRAAALAARLVERDAQSEPASRKLLDLQVRAADLDGARRTAFAFARATGELGLIHRLMEVYLDLGSPRRARAWCAFLVKKWPHSLPHKIILARLVARREGLDAGDRVLAAGVAAHGRNDFLERAYADVAFEARNPEKAQQRLRRYLQRHKHDQAARVAYGYALANTEGYDAADRWFERLDEESIHDAGALRGLAHMALRRKDRSLAVKRWARFAFFYPDDAEPVIEGARSLFDLGRADEALDACRSWTATAPEPHQGMEEFYGWLLVSTGAFAEARDRALACMETFGPSWTPVEVLVKAHGALGTLADAFEGILDRLPPIVSETDVGHLYSVARLFEFYHEGRPFIERTLPRIPRGLDLAWAHAYLHHGEAIAQDEAGPAVSEEEGARARALADWRSLRAMVDEAHLARFAGMGPDEVDAVLRRAAAERPRVHVVNMFEQASGGSELHALDVGERLARYTEVSYWAPEFPHPIVHAEHGVRAIDPGAGALPKDGIILFVGVYYDLGPWLRKANPSRILILYNTFDAVRLGSFIRTIHQHTRCKVDLLFCSDMMGDEVRLPGLFEPSPIDLEHYRFDPRPPRESFVIGRHSRDVVEKHNVQDGRVYEALIERGATVSLLGATCMRKIFPADPRLELRPAQRGGVREYLHGLDAFFYRTGTWIEPWGRVVIEAMALGIPVVVHERGGYAEAVESGADGFVFRTDEEAIAQLSQLKDDVELRARIGAAGRAKVERLLGEDALKRLLAYYLM